MIISRKNNLKQIKMKTIQLKIIAKSMLLVSALALIVFSISSCSKKIQFLTSTVVPAARGSVNVKTDKNKNFVINLQLTYLSESERLTPPKKTYIVWLVTNNNVTQNIGQIKTNNGLKASFQTVSSFKPTKIFITAEDNADITYPVSEEVLSTNKF